MRRRHRYGRKNPLTTTEDLLLAGLGLGVLGLIGYGIYKASQTGQQAISTVGQTGMTLAQVNAASGQAPLPGSWGAPQGNDIGSWAQWNQGPISQAQGGQPQPGSAAAFDPNS